MAAPPLSDDVCREAVEAVQREGNQCAAAAALGIARQTLQNRLKHASLRGMAPGHFESGVAPGYRMGKVTVQRNASGGVERTWERQSPDSEAWEGAREAIAAALADSVRGLAPVTVAPPRADSDLLAVYPMGDPHFGQQSWGKEAGEDFDLAEAERLTRAAIDRLVSSAPPAETGIILSLGDFFHADDQTNRTPAHKHQLDVDTRFPKILESGIRAMRHAILRALGKHTKVIVRLVVGNHDPHATWALRMAIAAHFENEPRVTVENTPSAFWFYRFGKVLIGATHGDKAKQGDLLGVMATDACEDWGQTKFRYWYTGHVHHQAVKELPGVVCESFRTLAAKDAYAAAYGYRAGRDMCLIVHHRDYGEIERHRCDAAMIPQLAA